MTAQHIRADDPAGPVYYARVLRLPGEAETWALVRDDSRNGGGVADSDVTREEWHSDLLRGVFVPFLAQYEVSQRARDETTECRHEFSCLTTGQCDGRLMCAAASTAGPCNLVLRDCARGPSCLYRVSGEYAEFCQCPTRFELYQQHGL